MFYSSSAKINSLWLVEEAFCSFLLGVRIMCITWVSEHFQWGWASQLRSVVCLWLSCPLSTGYLGFQVSCLHSSVCFHACSLHTRSCACGCMFVWARAISKQPSFLFKTVVQFAVVLIRPFLSVAPSPDKMLCSLQPVLPLGIHCALQAWRALLTLENKGKADWGHVEYCSPL